MPIIAYKTVTITLLHVQARRIKCELCSHPFNYVIGDTLSSQSAGVPLVSNSDKMSKKALKGAIGKLVGPATKPKVGDAVCPHCSCYQPWMVSRSVRREMGCMFLLVAVVVGAVAAAINAFFIQAELPVFLIFSVIGGLLGLWLGKVLAHSHGEQPEEENKGRSMTDEQVDELIAKSEEQEADPFLLWYFSIGNEPGDKQIPVSLGLLDQTDDNRFPPQYSTAHALSQAQSEG